MSLVTSNAGEIKMIQALLNGSPENLNLKLYQNNYTPLATSTVPDFSEATFTGYTQQTLTVGNWSTPTTNGSGEAVSNYTPVVFSCTGGSSQTVYGYLVVGASTSTLYWAEKFGSSRSMSSGIDLTLTASLSGQSAN